MAADQAQRRSADSHSNPRVGQYNLRAHVDAGTGVRAIPYFEDNAYPFALGTEGTHPGRPSHRNVCRDRIGLCRAHQICGRHARILRQGLLEPSLVLSPALFGWPAIRRAQFSRDALDAENVRGAMCETRDDCVLDNTYVRILRDFGAKNTERLQRILRDCFHHQAAQLKRTEVKTFPQVGVVRRRGGRFGLEQRVSGASRLHWAGVGKGNDRFC